MRIEKLEAEVAILRDQMQMPTRQLQCRNHSSPMENSNVSVTEVTPRSQPERMVAASAVDAGFITWEQATHWFQR
ncbi:hypothetical protein PtrARCrB10_09791 [Pyrenophora tritici-repentis]|nr:hypothetical protein PtrARCrB10_09791 [Pyrenophora tritici-repentis]